MKSYLIFFIFIVSFASVYSQTNYQSSIGFELGLKAGVSVIQTPMGRQNAVELASLPDIGIVGYYPISETSLLGIKFKLDLNNYSFGMKDYNSGKVYKQSMSYISLNPNIYFAGIIFGFGFGFPVSSNYDGVAIDIGSINNLYDLRFGYSYDIYYDESARLSISLIAQYMLNPIFNDFTKNDPYKELIPEVSNYEINNSHNPRLAGISLNISYQYLFNDTK